MRFLFGIHCVVVSTQSGDSPFFGGMMVIGICWRGAFLYFVKGKFVDELGFRRFRFRSILGFFIGKRIVTESFSEDADSFSSDLIKLIMKLRK